MIVLHIITGLNQGGAETALFRLVTHSSQQTENVVLSMTDMGVFGKELESKGIRVLILNQPQKRITLRGVFKLFKLIKKVRPDVVQTWMYHADFIGGVVAKIVGVKKIFWGITHFNLSRSINSRTTILVARLCAFISWFVPSKIIICAESSINVHKRVGYSDKFISIPLGYEIANFKRSMSSRYDLRQKWGVLKNEIVIGFVGRWDPQKDHKNLIAAFNIISQSNSNFKCVLIGPRMDTSNEELMSMIQSVYGDKKNILPLGIIDDLPSALASLDIHVLPSLGEAFPNVVAEAMASAIPCIVTDVGDAPIIVGNTGWVVPPGDSIKLSSAIKLAAKEMENKDQWKVRKGDCRKRIEDNYSIEKMVLRYYDVWNS